VNKMIWSVVMSSPLFEPQTITPAAVFCACYPAYNQKVTNRNSFPY
jgi:hypothetical protein